MKGLWHRLTRWLAPRPGTALGQLDFTVAPQLVQRDDGYHLCYQIAVPPGRHPPLRAVFARSTGAKAYYYFSVPTSHRELGARVERPLEPDGFTSYARRNAVYWLDPDGTEHPLPIVPA